MGNIFREKIIDIYNEFKDYNDIILEKSKKREEKLEELKAIFEKNRNAEEIKTFAFDSFFISSFQNLDLQIIQTKFVSYVELYLFDNDLEELPEEIMNTYGYIKSRLPKRMFLVKNNDLVELDKGSVKEKREKYEKENLFKIVEEQLNAALNVGKDR